MQHDAPNEQHNESDKRDKAAGHLACAIVFTVQTLVEAAWQKKPGALLDPARREASRLAEEIAQVIDTLSGQASGDAPEVATETATETRGPRSFVETPRLHADEDKDERLSIWDNFNLLDPNRPAPLPPVILPVIEKEPVQVRLLDNADYRDGHAHGFESGVMALWLFTMRLFLTHQEQDRRVLLPIGDEVERLIGQRVIGTD